MILKYTSGRTIKWCAARVWGEHAYEVWGEHAYDVNYGSFGSRIVRRHEEHFDHHPAVALRQTVGVKVKSCTVLVYSFPNAQSTTYSV